MLPASRLYGVDNGMINECGAVSIKRTGRGAGVLGENLTKSLN
jgi:hypothetical protein